MPLMLTLRGISAVACAILLASVGACGSAIDPPDYGGPEPPVEYHGPGEVHGTLSILAPVLQVPGRSQPERLYCNYSYGVFRPGVDVPLRQQQLSLAPDPADPAHWQASYSFADLPLGTYELRLYSISYPDWDIVDYHEFYRGAQFELSPAAPQAQRTEAITLDSYGAAGRIAGKIHVDGNAITTVPLQLQLVDEAGSPGLIPPFHWIVSLNGSGHGRCFYELSRLALEHYYLYTSMGSGGRLQQGDYLTDDPGVTLTEAEPSCGGIDFITSPWLWGPPTQPQLQPWEMGLLDLTLSVQGQWSGDLLVEIENTAGLTRPEHAGYFIVLPSDLEDGVFHEWLGYFDPAGTYSVRVLLLDAQGSGQQQLAAAPQPLKFIAPPWEPSDPPSLFDYPPSPQATLALTAELE